MSATVAQMVQVGLLSQQLCSRGAAYGEAHSIMHLWNLYDESTGFCNEAYRRLVCLTLIHNDAAMRAALSAQKSDYGRKNCFTQRLMMEYTFVVECVCYVVTQWYAALEVPMAQRVDYLTLVGPTGFLSLFTLNDLSNAKLHSELRVLRAMATLSCLTNDPLATHMVMQSKHVLTPVLMLLPMDVYDGLASMASDHALVMTLRREREVVVYFHAEFAVRLQHTTPASHELVWNTHQAPDVTMKSIFQSHAPLHLLVDTALELYMNCVQHAHKNHVAVKSVAPNVLRTLGFFSRKPSCWDMDDDRVLGVSGVRTMTLLQTKFLAEGAYVQYGIAMNVLREDLGAFYANTSDLLDFPDLEPLSEPSTLRIFTAYDGYNV